MPTLLSVKHLVQSLTKAEKRSFKLFAGLMEGEKDYLKLYEILSGPPQKADSIPDAFREVCPGSDINASCNYLYTILIKSLMLLNPQNYIDEQLLTGIQEVRVLFRKGLLEEGFKLLDKLRKIAVTNEKIGYCVILDKMVLQYVTRFQFKNMTETDLLKVQGRLRKNISYELNLADHSSLYELLYHRYLHDGMARSPKDKEKLNDLVVSEMNLAGNPRFQSFDLKKNHLLFQSVYFMMTGDIKSSLGTFYELNILFEENRQLWNDTPIYYINHLRGILNNLHTIGQFTEMDFFIEKLRTLERLNPLILLRQSIYCAEVKMFLGLKDYPLAFETMGQNSWLLDRLPQLAPADRAETVLYSSVSLILQKKFKQAANMLTKVIHQEYLQNDQLRRELRLINLVAHFQLHDFEYIQSEGRSLERELKRSETQYQTETVILKMIKKYPLTMSRNARNKLFDNAMEDLSPLIDHPYERHLFRVFDFIQWIKSHRSN